MFNMFNTSSATVMAKGRDVQEFAKLCMSDADSAAEILCKQAPADIEKTVTALMGYPGSIERLMNAETTPKWLKADIDAVLADFDELILT